MNSKQAVETKSLALPLEDVRLLIRSLFEDGFVSKADLAKLAPVWIDDSNFDTESIITNVFEPIWLSANAAFNAKADMLAVQLGRPLTEDERMSLAFPKGQWYAENQKLLSLWFENQMRELSQFLS